MHQQSRGKTVVTSTLVILVVYAAGLALLWNRANGIAVENSLMENLQAGALALACGYGGYMVIIHGRFTELRRVSDNMYAILRKSS